MHNLIEFLAKYKHWFVFVLLEVISFVLLFQYNSYQGSAWFSSANAVSGKIYEWNSAIDSFFSLTKVNEKLSQRNLVLEAQVKILSDSLVSVKKDSTLLQNKHLMALKQYRLIHAKVVSNTLNRHDNLMTIDKGSADGVKKDMGVVCGNGVVGIVYLVSAHYSVVLPVLNIQSNISCMIQKRGYFGYLHWSGGDAGLAYLDDIPRHAHFRLGDVVVTSGYSSVFPPGVMAGRVLHVYNSADGLAYRVQIRLSTDFGNLRDVFVVDNSAMKERIDIMRAAEDSIKVKEEEE